MTSPTVFEAISSMNIDLISSLSEHEIRPLLPSLLRIALCRSLDESQFWSYQRKRIMEILYNHEAANMIVSLLSVDFHSLEVYVKKEQQLRANLISSEESQSTTGNIVLGEFSYINEFYHSSRLC